VLEGPFCAPRPFHVLNLRVVEGLRARGAGLRAHFRVARLEISCRSS
jgi:hypothetical protein